jgi:hypothetical protein
METILIKTDNVLILPKRLSKKYGLRRGVKIFLNEERDHIELFPVSKEIIDLNKGFFGNNDNLFKALK